MESTVLNKKNVPEKKNVRILSVNWNDTVIGYLIKELNTGDYLYKYDQSGLKESKKRGYKYLLGFKDTRKVYYSKELFPAFRSRIPSRERRDIATILASLGIKEYDEFDLLALTGGRLFTDAISFKEYQPVKNKQRKPIKNDTTKGKEDENSDGR